MANKRQTNFLQNCRVQTYLHLHLNPFGQLGVWLEFKRMRNSKIIQNFQVTAIGYWCGCSRKLKVGEQHRNLLYLSTILRYNCFHIIDIGSYIFVHYYINICMCMYRFQTFYFNNNSYFMKFSFLSPS